MEICFNLNGQRICILIPELIDPYWWLHPDPPPESRWIESELIREEVARDLQGLATLHSIGNRIGGELGAKVHDLVQTQVKQLSLPKEVSIELSETA